jgi:DNA-binding CsgD family transcriptional regulator
MNIAPDTVDQNIKRFKQRLVVESKMELVKLFIEWGLIVNLTR